MKKTAIEGSARLDREGAPGVRVAPADSVFRERLERYLALITERFGWAVGHVLLPLDRGSDWFHSTDLWCFPHSGEYHGLAEGESYCFSLQECQHETGPKTRAGFLFLPDLTLAPELPGACRALSHGLRAGLFIPIWAEGTCVAVFELFSREAPTDPRFHELELWRRDLTILLRGNGPSNADSITWSRWEEQETMLDNVPALIFFKDDRNNIIRVNRPVAESFGVSKAEIEGCPSEVWYPEEAAKYYLDDLDVIRSGQPKWGIIELVQQGAGEKHWVRTDKIPFRDAHGKVVGVIVFAQDIHESVLAQQKLEDASRELSRSNRDLDQFASIISHDLTEPLRMISSFLLLLSRRCEGQLDSDAREFIKYAMKGATDLKARISALLEYSRVETRNRPFELTECGEALGLAASNLRSRIRAESARLDVGDLPLVMGDPNQLCQLFQHLLGNALKFRRPEEELRIQVSAERRDAQWLVAIEDNGIGIGEADRERVFLAFQKLCAGGDSSGQGMGLSVCRRIVERHRGRIWIEAAPEKGTILKFTLPVVPGS